MGELIAVLSGKGGTGKTTVCAGVASALAMAGESVLCIDCDVGLRNLDIALGISDLQALSFVEVYGGEHSLDAATRHPDYPSLAFLTAPVSCRAEEIDEAAFLELLQTARKQLRKDVDSLENNVMLVNIGLMPLLVAIGGLVYAFLRRKS